MLKTTLFLWAALAFAQPDEVRNPHSSPADVAQGEKTFRSHCSPCHGLKGEGGRGPNLASGVFYHGSSDAELLKNISDGIEGTEMPGLFYSPDRVWQVVAYIRSLNAASQPASAAGMAEGEMLFKKTGCVNCHRVNGTGGRMGPDLSEIGKSRSREHLRAAISDPNADVRQRYWYVTANDAQGRSYEGFLLNEDTYTVQLIDMKENLRSFEKSSLKMYKVDKSSKMPSFRDKLSEAQVSQLVAYLSNLRPQGGAR